MKIFALYLRVTLTNKPTWFNSLREKYSSNSILHITLIQPRYIENNKIDKLKNIVGTVLNNNRINDEDRELIFTDSVIEEDNGKYLLMSFVKNESIFRLQNNLLNELGEFKNYCDDITKEYEIDFRPHITVADLIDKSHTDEVSNLISKDHNLQGEIEDLVLAIVKEQSVEESENPDNWNVFNI
jgi:2'-5' RNA ligase